MPVAEHCDFSIVFISKVGLLFDPLKHSLQRKNLFSLLITHLRIKTIRADGLYRTADKVVLLTRSRPELPDIVVTLLETVRTGRKFRLQIVTKGDQKQ